MSRPPIVPETDLPVSSRPEVKLPFLINAMSGITASETPTEGSNQSNPPVPPAASAAPDSTAPSVTSSTRKTRRQKQQKTLREAVQRAQAATAASSSSTLSSSSSTTSTTETALPHQEEDFLLKFSIPQLIAQQRADPQLARIFTVLESDSPTPDTLAPDFISSFFVNEKGLLCRIATLSQRPSAIRSVLAVPVSLIDDFLEFGHGSFYAGHFGIAKSLDNLRMRFWWPTMSRDN